MHCATVIPNFGRWWTVRWWPLKKLKIKRDKYLNSKMYGFSSLIQSWSRLFYVTILPSWITTDFTYYLSHIIAKENFLICYSPFKASITYLPRACIPKRICYLFFIFFCQRNKVLLVKVLRFTGTIHRTLKG